MLNKEEIEKNMWKSKILGIFSEEEIEQITKAEIEESKKCLSEIIQNTYAERKAIKLENLKNYIEQLEFENKAYKAEHNHNITKIEQLESDNYKQNNIINSYIEREQKIINVLLELKKEFMEELKYNSTKREARVQLNLVDILLEKILKGEKDV